RSAAAAGRTHPGRGGSAGAAPRHQAPSGLETEAPGRQKAPRCHKAPPAEQAFVRIAGAFRLPPSQRPGCADRFGAQSESGPVRRAPMPVRQLSETTVNRIAAGEVVERPASVVKELVENALDAGATKIEVVTDGGGRRLIRVTDDGSGMPRADLALAVERHATSKLDDDDLLDIRTLGFRGEALPSIGAVARLAITTRHRSEPHAWMIAVDGGDKSEVKPAALGDGTRVEVRDLFYATPARLKFLKSDRTESEAIRETVRRLGMSRPDVAFTLAGEERAPVTWAAALPGAPGRLARLADILGHEFRANAAEVHGERNG